jgi:hypothetical protein
VPVRRGSVEQQKASGANTGGFARREGRRRTRRVVSEPANEFPVVAPVRRGTLNLGAAFGC